MICKHRQIIYKNIYRYIDTYTYYLDNMYTSTHIYINTCIDSCPEARRAKITLNKYLEAARGVCVCVCVCVYTLQSPLIHTWKRREACLFLCVCVCVCVCVYATLALNTYLEAARGVCVCVCVCVCVYTLQSPSIHTWKRREACNNRPYRRSPQNSFCGHVPRRLRGDPLPSSSPPLPRA